VLAAAHAVCHLGGREVLLPVDSGGQVELDALDAALADGPAIVSVMWVNNETGVIQSVREIAARCRDTGTFFHTDAVQAVGKVPVSASELSCTLLTISGHKIAPQRA
jgi:cysteine desulfurase